jgi:hypothetical protein
MLENITTGNKRVRIHGLRADRYPRLDADSVGNISTVLKKAETENPDLYREVIDWSKGASVTKDGKPFPESDLAVMWHSTNQQFDHFDYIEMADAINTESSVGFHMGTRFAAANRSGEGGIMIPVITSVQKLLRMPDVISFVASNEDFIEELVDAVAEDQGEIEDGWDVEGEDEGLEFGFGELSKKGLLRERLESASTQEIREIIEEYGYDGIVYENDREELNHKGFDSIIIFDPKKIRHAETLQPMWKQ